MIEDLRDVNKFTCLISVSLAVSLIHLHEEAQISVRWSFGRCFLNKVQGFFRWCPMVPPLTADSLTSSLLPKKDNLLAFCESMVYCFAYEQLVCCAAWSKGRAQNQSRILHTVMIFDAGLSPRCAKRVGHISFALIVNVLATNR